MPRVPVSDDPEDDASFVIPMAGLYADMETGRGCVRLPDEFTNATSAAQLGILAGWRRDLEREFEDRIVETFGAVRAAMPGVPRAACLERFLTLCRGQGLDCPPALLARLVTERQA